jgi:LAO/AO transport system kinase
MARLNLSKPFFVYMLRCADGSYYLGHTDDLERRFAQHQSGEIDGYTHDKRPLTLVWSQETASREEALAAEQQIKGWSRAKKEALIAGDWERMKELSRSHAGLRQAQPERGLVQGVLRGDRRALAKAITLIESTRDEHRREADALLAALLPHTGGSLRVGISGVPGVGKSTFIEALGLHLIAQGHRVAVLAVDPSSSVSGGSILGDKTRMERLSVHPAAFIRPSPTSGALGGVAEHTREAMLLCEAAGFDLVIVETVGVGQSETAVAGMTDLFALLQLPNAGDDLQAIKRGVMELADIVAINKADLDDAAATRAQAMLTSALRVFGFHGRGGHRDVPVLKLSALAGTGIDAFWHTLQAEAQQRRDSGAFDARRRAQRQAWLWDSIQSRLLADFKQHPAVRAALERTLADVDAAQTAPTAAARALLALFETH